jgi:hypothetical protein
MKMPSPGKDPEPEDPKKKKDDKSNPPKASSSNSGVPPRSAKSPSPDSLHDFIPGRSRHESPAHEIARLAEAFGGAYSRPLNTEGEILARISLLDENGDRIGISLPMRFATRQEMENICAALNIPEKDWPKSHT